MMNNAEGIAHQKSTNMSVYQLSEKETAVIRRHVHDLNKKLLQNNKKQVILDSEMRSIIDWWQNLEISLYEKRNIVGWHTCQA